MQRAGDARRTGQLVIEPASGTAILHGEEVELPLREFRLLAALAARVGEVVEHAALIEAVWPDAPYTTPQDLYVLVSKLRRRVDGSDRFGKNIRNRQGFGYVLDLPPDQVVLVDSLASVDELRPLPDKKEDSLAEEPNPKRLATAISTPPKQDHERLPTTAIDRPRWARTAGAAAVAFVLLGASWAGGFILSSRDGIPSESGARAQDSAESQSDDSKDHVGDGRQKRQVRKGSNSRQKRRNKKGSNKSSGPEAVAGMPEQVSDSSQTSVLSGRSRAPRKSSREKPAPPSLPAAPTRYLYHLFNTKSGDHFVTTDADIASTYQARGYQGGAIGRVYTSAEEGTKAIATNRGTAYIFTSATPRTKPASSTVRLFFSRNDKGDFFYTTNEAEASQEGWSSSLIGYVRTL